MCLCLLILKLCVYALRIFLWILCSDSINWAWSWGWQRQQYRKESKRNLQSDDLLLKQKGRGAERKMSLRKQEAGRVQTYGIQGSGIHWAREALVRSSTGQWQEGCLIFLVLMGTGTGKSLSRFHQLQTTDGREGPLEGKKRTDRVGQGSLEQPGQWEWWAVCTLSVPHSPHSLLGTGKHAGELVQRDKHFNMHTLFFPTFGCTVWHVALCSLTRDQPHAHCSGNMKS